MSVLELCLVSPSVYYSVFSRNLALCVNTLLKLNDVICSQITSIDNSIDASLFNIVISYELNFITTLIQKKC